MKPKYTCKKCSAGPFNRSELVKHYKQNHGGFIKKKKNLVSVSDILFCPRCGCNIKAVQAAMSL